MRRVEFPKLCFISPMVGRRFGFAPTQGMVLSDLFEHAGYPVYSVSASLNRYARLVDIVFTLVKRRRLREVVILDVFGSSSFYVEDIASRLCKFFNKPLIMILHGGDLPRFMCANPRWVIHVLKRADALVTPSSYLEHLMDVFGFEAHKIPNVVDLKLYPFRQRYQIQPRLLWMRSFHEIYNPFMVLRVLAGLLKLVPDATLVMAGNDKGLRSRTIELARQLGVESKVTFLGFLDTGGKRTIFDQSDIYINTNLIDNMPVSVIEAMAFGTPVISTNVGGIPHIFQHEHNGLLVASDDDRGMIEAILRLLQDSELTNRLSKNGHQLAEKSDWTAVRPQWEELFARLT